MWAVIIEYATHFAKDKQKKVLSIQKPIKIQFKWPTIIQVMNAKNIPVRVFVLIFSYVISHKQQLFS